MDISLERSGVTQQELWRLARTVEPYVLRLQRIAREKTYEEPESSIHLPSDRDLQDIVDRLVKEKVTPRLKYILLIGIGGSNLGTKAVYDAHRGFFEPLNQTFPKILFADAVSPSFLVRVEALLRDLHSPEELLINLVSKSGTTMESAVNADIILSIVSKKWKNAVSRLVVTTDIGSKLWNVAEEKGIARLPIPHRVGGRFSVFSPVGLFPLKAAGIRTKTLTRGAERMRAQCLQTDPSSNPALSSACVLYAHMKRGKAVHDSFFFTPECESLGKWYRQLLGESLGKEHDLEGKRIRSGITPTVSIGSTDLHSVGQLYLGGPRDTFTTFMFMGHRTRLGTPRASLFHLVPEIEGKYAREILGAIYEGVTSTYAKLNLPFIDVRFRDLSELALGEFLQWKMMEIMYAGYLLRVNAFDQPHVELYKKEIKTRL